MGMKPTSVENDDSILSPFELRAVESHQRYLSEQADCVVDADAAKQDWLTNHAQEWRSSRLHGELQEQWEEILKHKWIESEKAGRDLGTEAIMDWIENYAAKWRQAKA